MNTNRPERIPRSDPKKYRDATVWDKLGKATTPRTIIIDCIADDDTVVQSECFCGVNLLGERECYPLTCQDCGTVHHIKEND